MTTYSESWPDYVTLSQALRELKHHSSDLNDFFTDCGIKQHYAADTVLFWLGY